MLDIQFIRENTELVKKAMQNKGMSDTSALEELLKVDEKRRKLIIRTDELKQRRNGITEQIKEAGEDFRKKLIEEASDLKEEIQEMDEELDETNTRYNELLHQIPNLPFDDVPIGLSEEENVVIEHRGEKPKFDFEVKDHVELGKELDLIDFEAGAKVAGSQFYYLKNDLALLEFALVQYGMQKLVKKGFTPIITPDVARSRFYLGTGYNPKGEEAQIYEIQNQDLGLIATAEITMAGYHADEIIEEDELSKKYVAVSHCFRQEAGAYGKYSKGLYRVHQFTKVEMFVYCTPEESKKHHQEMLEIEKEIADELGFHYRVVEMCTGDLGAIAAKKYDLEAWMPGREDYGEITSTSNCTDYQARNLNIRYRRNEDGEVDYVHMLNGTVLVSSRYPIAILENFQRKDGTVEIPKPLQKYVGKKIIKGAKK